VGLRCACAKANGLCFRPHLGDEILNIKGRMKPPLTPLTNGKWLRNGKELNQEEEGKKTFGQRI